MAEDRLALVPNKLRLPCAKVLVRAIDRERRARQRMQQPMTIPLNQHRQSSTHSTLVTSASNKRKRYRHAEDESIPTSNLPFTLPLPQRPAPFIFPQLCALCENLSYFSGIYADRAEDAPGLIAYQLSCIHCLCRFLTLHPQFMADLDIPSPSPPDDSDDSSDDGHATSRNAGMEHEAAVSAAPTSWHDAGQLPSASDLDHLFHQRFMRSLRRLRSWWRVAYMGIRVDDKQLSRGEQIARAILNNDRTPTKMEEHSDHH